MDLLRQPADRCSRHRSDLSKVTESRSTHAHRPDWAGFALFSAALGALVYGLIESNEKSFSNPIVVISLAVAAIALTAFGIVEWRTEHPALDLTLFTKPTFTGGAVAAFGLSASIFALQLYLVLYIQDVLGYNPLDTGLRLLVLSAAILGTSTVVGVISSRVPVRLLIGPGLALVGVGLLLMRGLDAGSQWTDLLSGLITAGIGIGMVNPPLASTAVGVVTSDRAGMASGINDTFRQVGIATGIAVLGTLFSSRISSYVNARVSSIPGLGGRASTLASAVQSGAIGPTLKPLPSRTRQPVGELARSAFTSGLNLILLVAACIALAAAVISLLTIRSKDFVDQDTETEAAVDLLDTAAREDASSPRTVGAG